MKSKVLSLSAISASFIAILLTLGAYIEFVDLFSVIFSSVFVLLPLYYGSYKGSFLASLAGVIIAFLCGGLNILSLVFPCYLLFFGFYPIFSCKMQDKKTNIAIVYLIGAIWCLIMCYSAYFYYTLIMGGVFDGLPLWVKEYALIIVGVIGIIFYFVYDRFIVVIRRLVNVYLQRIIK